MFRERRPNAKMQQRKVYYFITYLVLSVLLSETILTGSAADSALTDEQKKEVEKLRAELDEAFNKFDEEEVSRKGIIVQPGWTKFFKPDGRGNTKVVVTAEGLEEARKLRDEIRKAVANDVYVASIASSSAANTSHIQSLDSQFNTRTGGGSAANKVGSTDIGGASDSEDLMVSSTRDGAKANDDGPNVVDTNLVEETEIDVKKLQSLQISKRRTKEVLVLQSVEEDFSFDLGDDVEQWAHILHAGEEYFVARRVTDLLIVRKAGEKYEPGSALQVGEPITYLETYSFWNVQLEQQEGIIIVATGSRVLWYRGNHETGEINLYWDWQVGRAVSGLTMFSSESNEYLAISSNESSRAGYYALNIYRFELESKEFWIVQRMQLQHPCQEVTIHDTGRDIILAVAQNNTAAIYTFNPHEDVTDFIRFKLLRSIESESIESVAAFKMGGRSYLALGGMQPQILLYQNGILIPKTILGSNFGVVELFFPIPVRTYRDDLILLVQHRVDFGTHAVTVLETLIWDGEEFDLSIPVPCQLGAQTVYGVSCMLDIQRDEGLKGAALLRRGDETSVIVPRQNAESGLFWLHTELLDKNSELLDLQEIFAFLKKWVKEQEDIISQAQEILKSSDEAGPKNDPQFMDLDNLKTPDFTYGGRLEEILVNGVKWTEEDTKADLDFIMNEIENLAAEINSKRQRREAGAEDVDFESLSVDALDVEDLFLDMLNHEEFFIQNGSLHFDGILQVDELVVTEREDIREKRQTMSDNLQLAGDIEFETINGVLWSGLTKNWVLRNEPVDLDALAVDGELIIEDNFTIDSLNALKFPEDFLFSSGPAVSVVTAEKTFTNKLSANAVDTNGLINGVSPFDAITLSEAQDWSGLPTFAHLTVSEKLELNGTVRGHGLTDFPTNPTLQDARTIPADCSFAVLEVDGSVYVEGEFDGSKLNHLLSDIVQLPEDPLQEISIPSQKYFSHLELPIDFNVHDNSINNISIKEFVTVHHPQDMELADLEGYVYFHNLSLSGTYDGVKIEELLQNAVKIDEPQASPGTQLNFVDTLEAATFNVRNSLNGFRVPKDYQTIHDDLFIKEAHFNAVAAKVSNVSHDIIGDGRLNNVAPKAVFGSGNSTTAGSIFVDELTLEQGLESAELHGIDASFLFTFLDQIDDLPEMILDGKIQVDHITITEDVVIKKLNGLNFDEDIIKNVIWLNRPNFLNGALHFVEPVEIRGDLIVLGEYNGQNLPALIDDVVFKEPNGTVLITAPKSFLRGVSVHGNAFIEAVNGVPFSRIATKKGANKFSGLLQINGNLIAQELEVTGDINELSTSNLSSLISYNETLQTFVLLGSKSVATPIYLEDLTVMGAFNDIPNLAQFFEDLVYKNQEFSLRGRKTFSGRVTIQKGAEIHTMNGNDLQSLFSNIILTKDSAEVEVTTPVVFMDAVYAPEVFVNGSIRARNLHNCSLEEWLSECIRVDKDYEFSRSLEFAPGALDRNSMQSKFVNDVELDHLITLKTDQNISRSAQFTEVHLDGVIDSKGPVNDVDLQEEYSNTLFTHGDQRVSAPLTVRSLKVLGNVEIMAPINNEKDLQYVATLKDNLIFESPLFFQNLSAAKVETNGLMSGIDVNYWYKNSLWLRQRPQQWITGKWSVRSLNVKNGPTMSSYMNHGASAMGYNPFMRSAEGDDRWQEICQKIEKLLRRQEKRAYFLKHLEESFAVSLDDASEDIHQAFTFDHFGQKYLLINSGCTTQTFKWAVKKQTFEKFNSFESGPIDEIVLLPSADKDAAPQFVTNAELTEPLDCQLEGLKVWKIGINSSESDSKEDAGHDGKNILLMVPDVIKQRVPFFNYQRFVKQANLTVRPQTSSPANSTRELTFSDFKQVVEEMLSDLIYRLSLDVNFTQLSIPESDLYDESLLEDFIAIVQEIHTQEILNHSPLSSVNLESLRMPSSPAEVLAVRSVLSIWPTAVEIEEVHSYLRNESHDHPLCGSITDSLGNMVQNLLTLQGQDWKPKNEQKNNEALFEVVERIQEFQGELEEFKRRLKNEPEASESSEVVHQNEVFATLNGTLLSSVMHTSTIGSRQGLKLDVGSAQNPKRLLATLSPESVNGTSIYISVDGSPEDFLQTIVALKPRALASLRVRDETLLAFVEDRTWVRVLVYRGTQGFINFSKFKVAEEVKSILSLHLPTATGEERHFLSAVFKRKVVFYEVVVAGHSSVPQVSSFSCD